MVCAWRARARAHAHTHTHTHTLHARGARARTPAPSHTAASAVVTNQSVTHSNTNTSTVCFTFPGTTEWVQAGQAVAIRPAYVMTHDNTAAVMPKFLGLGAARIANPRQVVFTLDHNVQDVSKGNLAKYSAIEAFAAKHGVDFYPAGRGIGHQVMCEEVRLHLISTTQAHQPLTLA
jgi:aconitase A